MAPTKLQRWIDLIAWLSSRRTDATFERIMEAIPSYASKWRAGGERSRESARRMFERDKAELRRLGFPLETVQVRDGGVVVEGYRLRARDLYLPYLRLVAEEGARAARPSRDARGGRRAPAYGRGRRSAGTFDVRPEELDAALEGLRRVADLPAFPFRGAARSALEKLAFDLPPDGAGRAPAGPSTGPVFEEADERLRSVADALRRRRRVRLRYRSVQPGEESSRLVAPWGLFLRRGAWYLVAHDTSRDALRTFRVSRIVNVEVEEDGGGEADYEVPPDFDLRAFARREAWQLRGGPPEDVFVLFRHPRSGVVQRQGMGTLTEARPDGSAVRRFRVGARGPFLRWLLTFGEHVQVLDPPEMHARLEDLARTVADVHGQDVEAAS